MAEENKYYELTRKAFSSLARYYNLMTLPLVRVRDQVVKFTGASEESKILDVATGTGQQAFAFAKQGYDVVGVDLTEAMLAVARKNNSGNLVKFEVGDATRLRFEAGSFEVTCISFALHDMPLAIREKVLQEMVRVTKTDGSIVIVDYALPNNKFGRFLIYHLITLYEGDFYKQFITSDLKGLIQKSGVKIVAERSFLLGAGRMLQGTIAH
jgi:demethylmenaquinone methyltransferase/2-methoxy-6-polyprenyl-1,4-benzoquinol methylase